MGLIDRREIINDMICYFLKSTCNIGQFLNQHGNLQNSDTGHGDFLNLTCDIGDFRQGPLEGLLEILIYRIYARTKKDLFFYYCGFVLNFAIIKDFNLNPREGLQKWVIMSESQC